MVVPSAGTDFASVIQDVKPIIYIKKKKNLEYNGSQHNSIVMFCYIVLLQYTYKFSYLRSLDHSTLYHPLLSIPQAGVIPRHREGNFLSNS